MPCLGATVLKGGTLRFALLQHEGLARGGTRVIHFEVRFLGGVVVKRVVVIRGDPRLGEDFPPY